LWLEIFLFWLSECWGPVIVGGIAFREDDVTTGAALYFLIYDLGFLNETIMVKLVHV
jgi:hypothetical protein